jgi:sarcosine oxidase subunit alpha
MSSRLPPQALEWIDRERSLSFSFEGKSRRGFAGDTVTSALLAQDQLVLGRSFKYHRPRGPLSLANHDINALVNTADNIHLRADVTALESGQAYIVPNTVGSVNRDLGSLLQLLSRFLPVGFYYKAFFRPRFLFPLWERMIRHMAGLGTLNLQGSARRKPKRYGFCDVLVVGAGPAGMAAAVSAAEAGASVILADENPQAGGSLDYQYANDAAAAGYRQTLKTRVAEHPDIDTHVNTEVSAWYTDHWLPLTKPEGIIKVRARAVVVASGVFEQPAVFRNNDVPGVMLASAAQRAMARFAIKPCDRALLLVANEDGYRAALDCLAAGVQVAAVADLGNSGDRGELAAELKAAGVKVYDNTAIYEVSQSRTRVTAARLCPLDNKGECIAGQAFELSCDGVLMSVGWAPAAALLYQSRCALAFDETLGQLVPQTLAAGIFAAGRVNGVYALPAQLDDGSAAGRQAAAYAQGAPIDSRQSLREPLPRSHSYPVFAHPAGREFVDFDEDLQLQDLINAASEGFDNIELMKRYSTIGMGPSQGKHSNMNGIRILARLRGQTIDQTGSTTARPMFHPVSINHLAGRRFRPQRLTPMQRFHEHNNAVSMEAGAWLRPEYYASGATRLECIHSEAINVRQRVGLIDISTLGKIEAFGPDSPLLMDRLYTMRMSTLPVGMSRYALMVDDAGVIIEDGVAVRYSTEHFYFTTTTGSSDSAYREIQRRIAEWGLNVEVVNRTGQLAAMNLAGPRSRTLLQALTDIDLAEAGFPYLGVRRGTLLGCDVTLIRVGFVGELGYEIHLRAHAAMQVWNGLLEAGQAHGIMPFGVEAQRLLRLEKGHIIVGQDSDGLTNPYEANMGWATHMKKAYFQGQRSLEILQPRLQKKLQGFKLAAGYSGDLPRECHLLLENDAIHGRVTSVAYSPTLQRVIGLAYVEDVDCKVGDHITIRIENGHLVTAEICETPFYDPQGARQEVA